jgi:hypothetical protein
MSAFENRAVLFELMKLSPGDVVLGTWPSQLQTEQWRMMNDILCFPLSLNIEFEGFLYANQSLRNAHLRLLALGTPVADQVDLLLASCVSFSFSTCLQRTSRNAMLSNKMH